MSGEERRCGYAQGEGQEDDELLGKHFGVDGCGTGGRKIWFDLIDLIKICGCWVDVEGRECSMIVWQEMDACLLDGVLNSKELSHNLYPSKHHTERFVYVLHQACRGQEMIGRVENARRCMCMYWRCALQWISDMTPANS